VPQPQKNGRPTRAQQVKATAFSRRSPSPVSSIADAVTIRKDGPFLLSQPNGNMPGGVEHGYGFYLEDCRFLDCLEMRIDGELPVTLMASSAEGFSALYQLSNPALVATDGAAIPERSLGIEIIRTLEAGKTPDEAIAHQSVTFQNYGQRAVNVTITLCYRSEFLDLYEIRGLVPKQQIDVSARVVDESTVLLARLGEDGSWRSVSISFSPQPTDLTEQKATIRLSLDPGATKVLNLGIAAARTADLHAVTQKPESCAAITSLHRAYHQSRQDWRRNQTLVTTSSELFDLTLDRSLLDLWLLRTDLDGDEYIAAGLPWFGTLFGRDSAVTAMQTLAFDFTLAERTLRILAHLQGTRVDHWRSEAPGKILHEFRRGELARADVIPNPYYGSVDSTPLFLILVAAHYAWSGDLSLFRELRPNVEAALQWIDQYGDSDGDGFVDYVAEHGDDTIVNQGWKDSGDAIMNADGSLAKSPIALVEVQGYVYLAKRNLADLFDADGAPDIAQRLRKEASQLRQRFNERFWLPDLGTYALALQDGGRPCAVVTSNPGQALWGEIVDPDRAPKVVGRLMDGTMFNGWGVRTLASTERRYNPIGYHLGTVWPHDNSLIATGLRKYGLDAEARSIFSGIFSAASRFSHYRLPELFAGYERNPLSGPAHYPVACHPQAWAAGSIPLLLQTSLGLVPDAPHQTLRVVRPDLPSWLDQVQLCELRVGQATVDLKFVREGECTRAEVTRQEGTLKVRVENTKR
jgi:glycogen debranching enzyme